jgi:hypothetical protein
VSTEAQAHEMAASTAEAPLAEVHAGSDIALKVKVSRPTRSDLQGGRLGVTADEGAAAKEDELVSFDDAAVEAAPAEVPAGIDMALRVTVACPMRCDLRDGIVRIAGDEGPVVEEARLKQSNGAASRTDELIVKAPARPGDYTWTAFFAGQEKGGILHQESAAPFSFVVKTHTTGMAVWDIPSPITLGSKFKVKVGAQCLAECPVAGRGVDVYDHQGARIAAGALGDACWSETSALYWTEMELEAPATEGVFVWEARFARPGLELPHEDAYHSFTLRTSRRPDHAVTVEVVDLDTGAPIQNADVVLHPFRAQTNQHGLARVMAANGAYEMYVAALGKTTYRSIVSVAGDLALRAEMSPAPISDESG